jgi:UDP-3-O-[3-hydroxymyristoyl] N-acetylglucosamine deacetylase
MSPNLREILQKTIVSPLSFDGVGLHSGKPARVTVLPARADHGIVFYRVDQATDKNRIPALWDKVDQTPLCTRLLNAQGASVSTVEHMMAALVGCGIHNARIEINGPEIPILDGSSAPFVRGILSRGARALNRPIKVLRILKPVEVQKHAAWARLTPHEALLIEFSIEFKDTVIGTQKKLLNMSNGSFVRELCNSRTFCRKADIDQMHANEQALGGTFENAVVVDGARVLSPGGLRHHDEAVRHKMLDVFGDLGLAGAPVLGHYQGYCAGHSLTNELLRMVFADPANYELVDCDAHMAAYLPGAGVHWNEFPDAA